MSDDEIAALDGDWSGVPAKEKAAFAFTRQLTFAPPALTAEDVATLKQHYTPPQVLEIVVSVAGYNATNRWTDALNIPAEASGAFFKREGVIADLSTFKTPTSARYKDQLSCLAPAKVPARPPLEPRDKVEAIWKETRSALLPLADTKEAAELWPAGTPPNWVRLLAVFPKAMKGRIAGLKAAREKGNISPRLKAEIAWVAARDDRAWYALTIAREQLKAVGFTEEQMFALDGSRDHLPEAERVALALVETMTVAPWAVTDDHVARLRQHFKDAEVAEIVHRACNAAFFNRATEAARLPFDR